MLNCEESASRSGGYLVGLELGYEYLRDRLVHQGSRYPASAAVPFLIDVVADPQAPDRFLACSMLKLIALGEEESTLNERPDFAHARRETARKATLSVEELAAEEAAWAAVAADPEERAARERSVQFGDVEGRSLVGLTAAGLLVRSLGSVVIGPETRSPVIGERPIVEITRREMRLPQEARAGGRRGSAGGSLRHRGRLRSRPKRGRPGRHLTPGVRQIDVPPRSRRFGKPSASPVITCWGTPGAASWRSSTCFTTPGPAATSARPARGSAWSSPVPRSAEPGHGGTRFFLTGTATVRCWPYHRADGAHVLPNACHVLWGSR